MATSTPQRRKLRVGPGRLLPFGCSEGTGGGVNFSLHAPTAEGATLLVEGFAPLHLEQPRNRTAGAWHCEVLFPSAPAGIRYCWVLDQPPAPPKAAAEGEEPSGLLAPPKQTITKHILDPCARVLDSPGAEAWNRRGGPAGKYAPSAVIPDFQKPMAFDWEDVEAPGLELKDLVIYEAHVRGFTKHPDSRVECWEQQAGTFLGFMQKIPHLLKLGINCVELLPIFEFDETACPRQHPKTGENLCNYWGYSTVSFFTPMQRFSARLGSGGGGGGGRGEDRAAKVCAAAVEFKTLVRELHRHGIEVVLDVVFNHTGEGSWGESNWHSLSAVAESHYYLMSQGHHTNYTGCGNTVNANNPLCTEWILDCVRYWALEMRVDGFRFDLAASLLRGQDGQISPDPLLVRRLANDPLLAHVKFIAEPWDCSWPDGYLVGSFPSGGGEQHRFAEWNGKFRDTVRRFIKGDEGVNLKGDFASRICGSADLYKEGGRGPCHSINFITAHDGFTLRDLVSFHKKMNSNNAEESGDDNNISWNCGEEGESVNPEVLSLRERQMRNFMSALFLAAGTPMLICGDEYGRSQGGNNNTWCQDVENWFSWDACKAEEQGLVRFCRLLIALRKSHSELFAREDYERNITWNHDNWEDTYNFLSFILEMPQPKGPVGGLSDTASTAVGSPESVIGESVGGSTCAASPSPHRQGNGVSTPRSPGIIAESDSSTSRVSQDSRVTRASRPSVRRSSAYRPPSLLVAFNAGHLAHPCHLPTGHTWYRLVDTHLEAPMDICESDEEAQIIAGDSYLMTPYSCVVLKSMSAPEDVFFYGGVAECGREGEIEEELRRVASRGLEAELLADGGYQDATGGGEAAVPFPSTWAASRTPPRCSDRPLGA